MTTSTPFFSLNNITAPRLPSAPFEYDARYQDQFLNVLRLYFNQLDNFIRLLQRGDGGAALNFPYGSFYSDVDQTAVAINTAYAVTFNNSPITNAVRIGSPTSRVVVDYPGVYNLQFSLQLDKTSGGLANIYVWARVDGTDVAWSTSRIHIQGNNAETVAAWNFVLKLPNAGSYFELMWATDDITAYLLHEAATAFAPAIPSAILTATFVSNLQT